MMQKLMTFGLVGISFLLLAVSAYINEPFNINNVLDNTVSVSYYGQGLMSSITSFLSLFDGIVDALDAVINFFTGDWWPF